MVLKHFIDYKYAYLWAVIVTFLCGTNGNNFTQLTLTFSSLFQIDKVAHFILFGAQTFFIFLGSQNKASNLSFHKKIFPAVVIGITFGIIIEILQATVFPNRSFDVWDMLADAIGCLAVWLILFLTRSKIAS
jgi:VanZ family protein